MKLTRVYYYQTPEDIHRFCSNKIVDSKGRRRFRGPNEKDEDGIKFKKKYDRYATIDRKEVS